NLRAGASARLVMESSATSPAGQSSSRRFISPPQPDFAVVQCGCQSRSVRRECKLIHLGRNAVEPQQLLPGFDVPETDGAVLASGCECPPVGRERESEHLCFFGIRKRMRPNRAIFVERLHREKLDDAGFESDCEQVTVRVKGARAAVAG